MIEMIVRSKWGGRSFSRLPSVVTQPRTLDRCSCTMIMIILGIYDNFDDDDADDQTIIMAMMLMIRQL